MLVNHYQNKLFKFLTTDTTAQSLLTTFIDCDKLKML